MTEILEYIQSNYIWLLGGAIIILLAIIGSYADKTNFGQGKPKEENNEKPDENDLNVPFENTDLLETEQTGNEAAVENIYENIEESKKEDNEENVTVEDFNIDQNTLVEENNLEQESALDEQTNVEQENDNKENIEVEKTEESIGAPEEANIESMPEVNTEYEDLYNDSSLNVENNSIDDNADNLDSKINNNFTYSSENQNNEDNTSEVEENTINSLFNNEDEDANIFQAESEEQPLEEKDEIDKEYDELDEMFNATVPEEKIIDDDLLDDIDDLSLDEKDEFETPDIPDLDDVELPKISSFRRKNDDDIWRF